jgi:hypothetical protein
MSPTRTLTAAALVALAIVPWVAARHQLSLLTDLLIYGLFALSLDLIMGYTGMVSFGHAAYFGLGAYASALVLIHFAQPVPVALLAGALLAGAVALPVGWFSTRATGIYFAILSRWPSPVPLHRWLQVARPARAAPTASSGVPRPRSSGRASLASPQRSTSWRRRRALAACSARRSSARLRPRCRPSARTSRFTSLGRDPQPFKLVFRHRGRVRRPGRALFAPFRLRLAGGHVLGLLRTGADDGLHGRHPALVSPIVGAMVFILIRRSSRATPSTG